MIFVWEWRRTALRGCFWRKFRFKVTQILTKCDFLLDTPRKHSQMLFCVCVSKLHAKLQIASRDSSLWYCERKGERISFSISYLSSLLRTRSKHTRQKASNGIPDENHTKSGMIWIIKFTAEMNFDYVNFVKRKTRRYFCLSPVLPFRLRGLWGDVWVRRLIWKGTKSSRKVFCVTSSFKIIHCIVNIWAFSSLFLEWDSKTSHSPHDISQ